MSQRKPRQSNSSRTFAIAAVVLLIIVAIAGIVLAGRNSQETTAAVDAAPAAAPVTASTSQAAAAPTGANPNEVVFANGSDKLPSTAAESVARFAEAARSNDKGVRLSARFLTGENKARDLALATARTGAIRQLLQAGGVAAEKIQAELVEMPAGSLKAADADRVDLYLR